MMQPIILSSGSLYNFDLDTVFALAAEAGFDGVELMVDWRRETYRPAHLERLMSKHNLPILAVHSPFLRFAMQGWPGHPVDRVKESVKLAEAVGAQTVVVHPPERWLRFQTILAGPRRTRKLTIPVPVAGEGELGRWLKQNLAAYQTTTPVKVAVENMPCRPFGPFNLEPHYYHQPDRLRRFQHLTLDTTHVGTRRADLLQFYGQLKAQVAHVHLSNYNGQEHQLVSNGELPLAALLEQLRHDHFEGCISLELGPYSLQADDEQTLRQNLRDCLVFCQQALRVG